MKHLIISIVFLFSAPWGLAAQNGAPPAAGARGIAMGGASVLFQDVNSLFGNQAGMAHLEGLAVSLTGEQRFVGTDIGAYSLALAYPVEKAGAFGLSANYFGVADYNETRIGLAYARKLSKKLSIGAQFDYIGFSISEYGNKSLFTFEIGLLADLTEDFRIGLHLFNPVRQEVVENENLPTAIRLGAGYAPNEKLLLSGELEKDMDMDMQFKAGVEYFIIELLALRAGVSTNPTQNSFGIGVRLKNGLSLDFSSRYHYSLGFSPAFGLSYGW